MTEREYILRRLLHLSSFLATAESLRERENLQKAILFYAKELERIDRTPPPTYLQ